MVRQIRIDGYVISCNEPRQKQPQAVVLRFFSLPVSVRGRRARPGDGPDRTEFHRQFLFDEFASVAARPQWSDRADPDNGYFADFPTLGVDSNAVYLAGDMYHGTNNSLGTSLTMIPKAGVLWLPNSFC